MNPLVESKEISDLRSRFGEPLNWARSLSVSDKLLTRRKRALESKRGEAVLVIPRPGNRVLLHTKAFYPQGAFRLLSGGIERKETVLDAIHRELAEETGFGIQPVRFLGLVEYELVGLAERIPWVSYVFQTEETGDTPHPTDIDEQISEFRDVEWHQLPAVADNLERLEAGWNDWGRFRAAPHRLVWQAAG